MGLFDFFSSSSLSSDESTILARIKPVIADFLVVDASEIRPETTLDELGCDELDRVELFIAFAEQLNYHTPPKVEKHVHTVRDIIRTIKKYN